MKTDVITSKGFLIDNIKTTVTNHEGFPSSLDVMVSGTKLGMDINAFVTLSLVESECLEVVEYYSGDGYGEYMCDAFPQYKFIANIGFTRMGQDFVPIELQSNKLEMEVIS